MGQAEVFAEGKLIPGTVYRVRALIGRGGMGAVYEVEHAELGRIFVLKALHGHLASRTDLVARMRNEWRALAKLNHPHIVQVTDAGQTQGGIPYFVMEHLKGQPLSALLASEGRLGLRRACSLIVDVLEGLSAAHATGAIHRDVKPPNIFVTESDRAKLLDFGIAKLRDRVAKVVTVGGVSIGTPRFMAPEQAEGGRVDGRADIYAAGLVLFECVVGRGPFSEIKNPSELVMAHIEIEPPRADHLDERVPEELGDLIHRWLSKSPASRPQTAGVAARELTALAKAFTDDLDLSLSLLGEATVHAEYDSVTVGAPPSLQFSDRAPKIQERETESGQSPVAQVKTLPTITSVPSEVSLGGGGGLNPKRTVAWGTPEATASSQSLGLMRSSPAWGTPAMSSSAQVPRTVKPKPSETPSPVSTPAGASSPLPPSRPSLVRLTLAAALVAFAVAGGVTLLTRHSEPPEPASSPTGAVRASPVASFPPKQAPRVQSSSKNSVESENTAPLPSAPQQAKPPAALPKPNRPARASVSPIESTPALAEEEELPSTPNPTNPTVQPVRERAGEGEASGAPAGTSGPLPGSGL